MCMSDPLDVVTTAGTAIGSSGIVAGFMRWIAGREAAEVATRLAVIEEQLKQLTSTLAKHGEMGERVALLEQAVKAVHERLDGRRGKR